MANISKEDDARDFEERRKNNWNRPRGPVFPVKTKEDLLRELEDEVRSNIVQLRRMRARKKIR